MEIASWYCPLSPEEERDLCAQWKEQGNLKARDAIIRGCTKRILFLARKYRGYGIGFAELVSEGILGLMEAAERYKMDRGTRFLTYGNYYAEFYMLRYVFKYTRMVSMTQGSENNKAFFNLKRAYMELKRKTEGEEVSFAALADELGVSEESIERNVPMVMSSELSLDQPQMRRADSDKEADLYQFVQDSRYRSDNNVSEAEACAVMKRAVLHAMDAALNEREQTVIRERYLNPEGKNSSLQTIGKSWGVSREYVRQVENRALKKLQKHFRAPYGTKILAAEEIVALLRS